MRTLDGYLVIDLSLNLPGPLATARLAEMGARVVKVEPPGGDPAERFSVALYSELKRLQEGCPSGFENRARVRER